MVGNTQMVVDAAETGIQRAIASLLAEARAANRERRASVREPFFGPVNVTVRERGERRNYSCISRDISSTGIGLLHNMPLELGEVVLTIGEQIGGNPRLRSRIVWCRPCGEGWYLSGAEFVAVEPTE
jgi:hypothetical protein